MNRVIKLCKTCGIEGEHAVRPTGTPFSWCMECQREYSRSHYNKNKDDHNRRRYTNKKGDRAKIRKVIDDAKHCPCTDCKLEWPSYVMDFDHIPGRGEKLFNISDAVKLGVSIDTVLAEIEKCDVVCSNCHRIRTFESR